MGTFVPYASAHESQHEAENFKMILKIFIVFAVTIAASAVNQGDEVGLLTILAKERKEMRKIFQRETERLRGKLEEQRQEDDKLHQKLDKLHSQNEKQHAQIAKLQKENQVLHRANSKINKVIRQRDIRDPNNTREFDAKIKNSLRQNDLSFELKKMMRAEIKNYLTTEKNCVAGTNVQVGWGKTGEKTVEFKHTFPRKPTVFAALSFVRADKSPVYAYVGVMSVTNSSAVLYINNEHSGNNQLICWANWMACL